MAQLFKASGGAKAQGNLPESWAAPASLFDVVDRNDGSIYGWNAATSLLTLPASELANGYLIMGAYEYHDTSNGRFNPQGRFVQVSGTGNFVSGVTGGYNRDASEDRSYVRTWAIIDNPSALATIQFQWKADADDATGGTQRSEIQVIPLYYSNIGMYTSADHSLYGGVTPNQVVGFSAVHESDTAAIEIASNVVTVKGDNKRYLAFGAQHYEGRGGRTQRWIGFRVDGTKEDAAKACVYYRSGSDDESGGMYNHLLETATADRTLDSFCYRGDGIGNGQGGADADGSDPTVGTHAMVVIELNDSAEVFAGRDTNESQNLATAGALNMDIAQTTDIEDTASFTSISPTQVSAEQAMDALLGANIGAAQNNVGVTQRWTAYAELQKNGTVDADSFHGNYMRNNQGSIDTFGYSANLLGALDFAQSDTMGVKHTELTGSEGGGGNITSPAGWQGFWALNLDTLEGGGETVTPETDVVPATYAVLEGQLDVIAAEYGVVSQQTTVLPSAYAIPSAGATCLAGFTERKPITITGSVDGAQTDYQISVRLHKASGTDTATDIYLGTGVRDDFGDVRFTADDGLTELSYYLDNLVSGSYADVVIKVPSIPASPSTVDMYVQYGNATETTTGDIKDTFVAAIDVATDSLLAYAGSQDNNQNITLDTATNTIVMQGAQANNWKAVDVGSLSLTSGQYRLGLWFEGGNEGEIIAIGLDNQLPTLPASGDDKLQQFWGTQVYNDVTPQYSGSGKEFLEFDPALTGTYNYLTVIHDEDTAIAPNSRYSNVRIRKYTTNEPTITNVGAAETCGAESVTTEQDVMPSSYAVRDTQTDVVGADYAVKAEAVDVLGSEYAVRQTETEIVQAAYSVVTGALEAISTTYAVNSESVDPVSTGYAVETVDVEVSPSEYAVLVQSSIQEPAAYAVRSGALDVLPTNYAVIGNELVVTPSGYGVQDTAQDAVQVDYAVLDSYFIAIPSGYEVLVEGTESDSVPTTYSVRTEALDVVPTDYAVNTTEQEAVGVDYAVQAQQLDVLPATYGVITDALEVLPAAYATREVGQVAIPTAYAARLAFETQVPTDYRVLTNSLDSLLVAYKVNQLESDVVPAVYTVLSQQTIALEADYFVQLPITAVLTVVECSYAVWDIDKGCKSPFSSTPSPYQPTTSPYGRGAEVIADDSEVYTRADEVITKTCL